MKVNFVQKGSTAKILYNQVAEEAASDTGISFSTVSSDTNGNGIYTLSSTASDTYPIYYYRGAVINNNVIFGGFCWQIVRTTNTGGVKLIYNGTPTDGTCVSTGSASMLSTTSAMETASYATSSVHKVVEEWFEENLTDFITDLEDIEWCGGGGTSSSTENSSDTSDVYNQYSYTTHYFESYSRLINNKMPSLTCTGGDIYTSEDLTYPVALITADEMAFAGKVFGKANESYYLYTGKTYWTMTLSTVNVTVKNTFTSSSAGLTHTGTTVTNSGKFFVSATSATAYAIDYTVTSGIRPMVSLKVGTTYTGGTGTTDDPYIIG